MGEGYLVCLFVANLDTSTDEEACLHAGRRILTPPEAQIYQYGMLPCRLPPDSLATMALPDPSTYSLSALASLTGIPERTIRSYIGRGLLPPPDGRGRAASYAAEHLERLQFLQRVRAAVPYELPLALVEKLLKDLPPEQIARIARGEEGVMAVPVMQEIDPSFLRRKRAESELVQQRLAGDVVREEQAVYPTRAPGGSVPTSPGAQADFLETRRAIRSMPLGSDSEPMQPQSLGRSESSAGQAADQSHSVAREQPSEAAPELPETWTTLQVTPSLRLSMRGQAPAIAKRLTLLAERLRQWLGQEDSK
jgi:DNA-binding transcriptional MerR regulator